MLEQYPRFHISNAGLDGLITPGLSPKQERIGSAFFQTWQERAPLQLPKTKSSISHS